jgi:hypothetical protein
MECPWGTIAWMEKSILSGLGVLCPKRMVAGCCIAVSLIPVLEPILLDMTYAAMRHGQLILYKVLRSKASLAGLSVFTPDSYGGHEGTIFGWDNPILIVKFGEAIRLFLVNSAMPLRLT